MSILNIFQQVKEVNDKLITIEMENRQLKEKISEFSQGFKEIVDKLNQRNHEMELRHAKEVEALRTEIAMLRNRFDVVTEQALFDLIKENGNQEALGANFVRNNLLSGKVQKTQDKNVS